MRRRGIQIKIAFLHILAMVSFRPAQAEESFLQDAVFAIPKCQRKAQAAFSIADSQQPVFTPPVGAAAGMIMGKVIPAVTKVRVIFAHSTPLPFRQIRPPTLPVGTALTRLSQSKFFSQHWNVPKVRDDEMFSLQAGHRPPGWSVIAASGAPRPLMPGLNVQVSHR